MTHTESISARIVTGLGAGWSSARERADSEFHALAEGLPVGRQGPVRFRKWLGWALFRLAAWVNPEVADS